MKQFKIRIILLFGVVCYYVKLLLKRHYLDYFYFPFNILKPMNSNAPDTMKKGCDILNGLGIKYCLADGTLLGIYRDDRIIPHDTDIDVTVIHPVDTTIIEKAFKKNGFKVGRKVTVLNKVQQIIFYSPDEILFDIIFYTRFGDKMYAFCEKDCYFIHDASFYERFVPHQFNADIFYIPQDVEKWLEHVYGTNWKIPAKKKPDNWREGGTEYLSAEAYTGNLKNLITGLSEKSKTVWIHE